MNTIITFMENLVGIGKQQEEKQHFKERLHAKIRKNHIKADEHLSITDISNTKSDVSDIVKHECEILKNLGWVVTTCTANWYPEYDNMTATRIRAYSRYNPS